MLKLSCSSVGGGSGGSGSGGDGGGDGGGDSGYWYFFNGVVVIDNTVKM